MNNMNKVYVSPVCHLDEVAAQMNICGVSGGETTIKSPTEGHSEVGPGCAPKVV